MLSALVTLQAASASSCLVWGPTFDVTLIESDSAVEWPAQGELLANLRGDESLVHDGYTLLSDERRSTLRVVDPSASLHLLVLTGLMACATNCPELVFEQPVARDLRGTSDLSWGECVRMDGAIGPDSLALVCELEAGGTSVATYAVGPARDPHADSASASSR